MWLLPAYAGNTGMLTRRMVRLLAAKKERDRERSREKKGVCACVNLVEVGAFLIPALWGQEDSCVFKACQGCTVSLCLKTKTNKTVKI